MIREKADAVTDLLDDRFPDSEVILTRRPRDPSAVSGEGKPKDYRVEITLTAPLARGEVAFLADLGRDSEPDVDFSLTTSMAGVGSTITAVYE